MGIATKIPQDTFEGLQLDAGVLLNAFNPAAPAIPDSAIICATTGGITVSCVPSYSDLGEDVDNCPNDMMELKKLESWECKISTSCLGTSTEAIRLALGAADITAASSKITPRRDLSQNDFCDVWWVGDRADGGLVAVKLKNALSTSGFSLKTTKNGKGQIDLELTGHVSMNAQDVMPMEFYSLDSTTAYAVVQELTHVTSSYAGGNSIAAGDDFETTLAAADGYTIASVVVLYNGEDVTASKYTSGTGKVEIASVAGDIKIIATATET